MKRYLFPLGLAVAGALLIFQGQRRADSLAGRSEELGKDIANAVDGDLRQPDHVYYYAGGAVLVFVGLLAAWRHRSQG